MAGQIASTIGAVMILVGYVFLQTGRFKETSLPYLHLNFVGGSLLFYAALLTRQAGFILLEGAWVVVTLFAYFRRRKT